MNEIIRAIVQPDDDAYTDLPDALKLYYSREQYLWLTDDEKASLVQRETEPDF